MFRISVALHPRLNLVAFETNFPSTVGSSPSPAWLVEMLDVKADAPISTDDTVRRAVRDMLRSFGYKPSGRGKPASEFLLRSAEEGTLGPINLPVDVCNVVSLHSGLPISVVDLDRSLHPYSVDIAPEESSYVFNASGQEIRLDGIPCLFDAEGPCANAVRDSQRTKTSDVTRRTLSVVWGSTDLPDRTVKTGVWYRDLLARLGAETHVIATSVDAG